MKDSSRFFQKEEIYMIIGLKRVATLTFSTSRLRRILAGAVGGMVLLFLLFLAIGLPGFRSSVWKAVVLSFGGGAVMAGLLLFDLSFSPKADVVLSYLLLFLSPLIALLNIEWLQQGGAILRNPPVFIVNYAFFLCVYLIVYLFSNRIRAALLTGNLLFFIIGTANFYVLYFRGCPLLPWDILATRTALNVVAGIQFPVTLRLVAAVVVSGVLCALTAQIRDPKPCWGRPRLVAAAANFALIAVCSAVVGLTANTSGSTFHLDPWDSVGSARKNGYVINFLLNLQSVRVPKPEGYSTTQVTSVVSRAFSETPNSSMVKPSIIAVMNEAFSDLNVLGNMNLSEDAIPFFHSLQDNTVRGRLVVPAYGGATCNTEYEFLTGNVCSMLRPGTYPMQQYVTKSSPSLATTLKAQGYQTIGIHPYYGSGWNRSRAYPLLGFDRFLDITAFETPELVRSYISDNESYRKIIEQYEARGDDPIFIFNVTMQNHASYAVNPDVLIEGLLPEEEQYPETAMYLSLLRKSDEALKSLITYFECIDEPVIIAFFGDHQPALSGYTDMLLSKNGISTSDRALLLHSVPFFIWANYDIEEQTDMVMSVNYLSTILLKTAGLRMPQYNHYLYGLFEQLPVISSSGVIDSTGNRFSLSSVAGPYANILDEYTMVQYNQVFDKKRTDELYYLTEQLTE